MAGSIVRSDHHLDIKLIPKLGIANDMKNINLGAIELSRKALYEEIWNTPVLKLCERFGISNVGLAKLCKRNAIPLPPRGYWAKKEHGHRVRQTPLQKPEDNHIIQIKGNKPVISEKVEGFRNIFDRALSFEATRPSIVVSDERPVHPLVRVTEKAMQKGRDDWRRCNLNISVSLDITVSKAHFNRSLRIMNALTSVLESSGYRVELGCGGDAGTCVDICGEVIGLRMIELLRVSEKSDDKIREAFHPYPPSQNWRWKQTVGLSGVLCLELFPDQYIDNSGLRRRWRDGKKQRLEDCLNDIVFGLIRLAAAKHAQAEHWSIWPAKNAAEQAIADYKKQKAAFAAKIESTLDDEVSSWTEAKNIRAYIQALEAKMNSFTGPRSEQKRIHQWMSRLRDRADAMDPLHGEDFERIGVPDGPDYENQAVLRSAIDKDYEQITGMVLKILAKSFGSGDKEAALIKDLKESRCFDQELSIVSTVADRVVGYVLLSNIGLRGLPGICGVALAPLCVEEKYRRRTIGSQMVEHGLAECRKLGKAFVFVQGDPKLFGRFGFRPLTVKGYCSPFASPDDQILLLDSRGLPKVGLVIEFPDPWKNLLP